MKHIAGWFRRNNTIMAQAKDLSRQLQEAWDDTRYYSDLCGDWVTLYKEIRMDKDNLRDQLHRVARERDNERKLRLEAEDRLLDYHLDKREKDEEGRAADRGWLDTTDNEEE